MHVDSKNDIAYFQTVFASEFGRIVCQAKIEPYALRGMLQNGVIGQVGHKIKIVIEMLDDSRACPGAAVLTEADRIAIRDLQSGQ